MSWQTKQWYCECQQKWCDAHHMSNQDPRAKGMGCAVGGGLKLINTETGQDYCTACKQFDTAAETVFHCDCGRVLKPNYTDSAVAVQAEQEFIVTDGQQAYVVTRTDIAALEQRLIHNIRGK